MHSFCIRMALLPVPVSCVLLCLPFSFCFFFLFHFTPTPTCLFPRNPTRCKCIRRYAFPYSHPLRSVWCLLHLHLHLLLILDLSTSLPARGTIIINSTISNSIFLSLSLSCMQLAVNLNAPWRLSLLPFYVIRFFLFSHRSTAQQQQQHQPQHLMHSQCQSGSGGQAPGRMRLRKLLINSPSTMLHLMLRVHRRRLWIACCVSRIAIDQISFKYLQEESRLTKIERFLTNQLAETTHNLH